MDNGNKNNGRDGREKVRVRAEVTNVSEKIGKARLKRLGHVEKDRERCNNENM